MIATHCTSSSPNHTRPVQLEARHGGRTAHPGPGRRHGESRVGQAATPHKMRTSTQFPRRFWTPVLARCPHAPPHERRPSAAPSPRKRKPQTDAVCLSTDRPPAPTLPIPLRSSACCIMRDTARLRNRALCSRPPGTTSRAPCGVPSSCRPALRSSRPCTNHIWRRARTSSRLLRECACLAPACVSLCRAEQGFRARVQGSPCAFPCLVRRCT